MSSELEMNYIAAPVVGKYLKSRSFVSVIIGPIGCLSGDTEVFVNRGGNTRRKTMKELYTAFNGLKSKKQYLCSDCLKRLKTNPLRVLDCKKKKCQIIVSQAPKIIDHLCKNCHKDFKDLLEFLEELEIPYILNPYLVRGLDYYTKTVFEIFSLCLHLILFHIFYNLSQLVNCLELYKKHHVIYILLLL